MKIYYKSKFYLILFLLLLCVEIKCFISTYNDIKWYININKIKIGYFCNSIKYGGVERVMAIIINFLSEEKMFIHYLITRSGILNDEYTIPNNTRRINLNNRITNIFKVVRKYHIDILIYNFYNGKEIAKLNKLKKTKIIFYNHSSYFYWIYLGVYNFKKSIYNFYKDCNYVISLIPVENDYLFKKWGINSILMDNPLIFEYDSVIPSKLLQKNIIMIGRSDDPIKRYDLGIKAMVNIIKEIPTCEMNIVSVPNKNYTILISSLNLTKNVRFVGYQKNVEIYFKNTSLHILPSLSESYSMVLSESKIFGVPSIICGLDYLALANGGNIIIYDDNPDTIAKEAIKILNDDYYRFKLGIEARQSMKNHSNKRLMKKWTKLIMSVFRDDNASFKKLCEDEYKISDEERDKILNNQFKLFVDRKPEFNGISFENFVNYSF